MASLIAPAVDPGDLANGLFAWAEGGTYGLVCAALFLALVAWAAAPMLQREGAEAPDSGWRRLVGTVTRPWAFGALTTLVVLACRWPGLAWPELDYDEGTHWVCVLGLAADPIYWRSADAITNGPLSILPLFLGHALGLAATYGTSRLLGLCMAAATLVLLQRALTGLFGHEGLSRLAVLPAVACTSVLDTPELWAYTAETPANLALAVCLWLFVRAWDVPLERLGRVAYGLGFALGCVPFTKMQVGPAGLVLALAAYAQLGLRLPPGGRKGPWIKLTLGGGTPALLAAAHAVAFGVGRYAWRSYFAGNLAYASEYGPREGPGAWKTLDYLFGGPDFGASYVFMMVCAVSIPVALVLLRGSISRRTVLSAGLAPALLGAVMFGVLLPPTRFHHYLWLPLFPLALCCGVAVGLAWEARAKLREEVRRHYSVSLALILLLVFAAIHGDRLLFRPVPAPPSSWRDTSPVTATLAAFTRPADSVVVWGPSKRFAVEAGLRLGTRFEGWPHRFREGSAYHEYWTEVFMADWRRAGSAAVVDMSAAARDQPGAFPRIAAYLEAEYDLVDEVADRAMGAVRVHVARSRLDELLGAGTAPLEAWGAARPSGLPGRVLGEGRHTLEVGGAGFAGFVGFLARVDGVAPRSPVRLRVRALGADGPLQAGEVSLGASLAPVDVRLERSGGLARTLEVTVPPRRQVVVCHLRLGGAR